MVHLLRWFRGTVLCAALSVVFLAAACDRSEPLALPQFSPTSADDESVAVANVDDVPITIAEFRRALARSSGHGPDAGFDRATREQILEKLIRTKLLAAAGRAAGYADDPEIVATVDRLVADRYLRDLVRANPAPPPVTDDEIRAYYESHLPDFTPLDRARASVVLLEFPDDPTPEQKDWVRQRIEELRARAIAERDVPGSFVALVQEHSADTMTRLRGGDLGWIGRGQNPRPAYRALSDPIFALDNIGDVSEPIATDSGYAIAKLTDRTRPEPRPLAAVEKEIRSILEAKQLEEINDLRYAQLRERFSVKVNDDVLAAVGTGARAANAAPRPPPIPGVPGPPVVADSHD